MISNFKAFITGSYAYGTPTNDSDIDLVVYMRQSTAEKLVCFAEMADEEGEDEESDMAVLGNSLVFGKLNLICVYDEEEFLLWKKATNHLKKIGPVTRQFAIDYLEQLKTKFKQEREDAS